MAFAMRATRGVKDSRRSRYTRRGVEDVDEVSTRRLTIVDDQGRVRATLGPTPDGSVELRLFDADDRTRVELAVAANGTSSLTLRDPDGEMRSCLAVGIAGDTHLHLHGAAAVSLHDREGQPRAQLGLDEHSGIATLSYVDAEGGSCVLLTEDASGGRLHLFQRDGTGRRIPAGDPIDPANGADTRRPTEHPPAPARRRWLPAALLVLVSASIGSVSTRLGTAQPVVQPAPAAATPRDADVVNAREIVLWDSTGSPRIRLGAQSDGTPLLWMTDGTNTVEVGAMSDVGAIVRLNGGRSSVALVAPPKDPPSVSASVGDQVLFQAPSHVARFLPQDLWPDDPTVSAPSPDRTSP
jgi:hypothetical protein